MSPLEVVHLRRADSIVTHEFGHELLIYCPDKAFGVTLNSSAKEIWELCDGRLTSEEIGRVLGTRLGISDDQEMSDLLNSDVLSALSQLRTLGLLECE